jgi:hypothetical protein
MPKRYPVGLRLEPLEFRITQEMHQAYVDAVGDKSSYYINGSYPGSLITNPILIVSHCANLLATEIAVPWLYAKADIQFVNPPRVNKWVRVESKVVDNYIKRDKTRIVIEQRAASEDGFEIVRCSSTIVLRGKKE